MRAEGLGACRAQVAKKGDRRTAGFGCFFYDGLVVEKKGGGASEKLGPLKWVAITEQEIKQYVNLPSGKINEGKERLIQVEADGAVDGSEVFWKIKAWEKNSKRTAPKLGVKKADKVDSKEGLLEFKTGPIEVTSTFKDGKASIIVACGSAGGDTFIVEAGSSKEKMDVKVAICNWRKLNYEIMAPDFMSIPEKHLPEGG